MLTWCWGRSVRECRPPRLQPSVSPPCTSRSPVEELKKNFFCKCGSSNQFIVGMKNPINGNNPPCEQQCQWRCSNRETRIGRQRNKQSQGWDRSLQNSLSQEQRTSTTESYVCCSISGGWRGARRWRSQQSWSLPQERPGGGSKVQEMEIEGGFEDLGDEGAIIDGNTKHTNIMEYKCKYDLGYEGAVLHETGKTDHHQSSREQSSCLSLHATGAVDRRPDVFFAWKWFS